VVAKLDQLTAFLDRSKQLKDGPEAAINIEYLKNCVFKFMSSARRSDRMRLYPVIATILKLTPAEKQEIEAALRAQQSYVSQLSASLATGSAHPAQPAHGAEEEEGGLVSSISSSLSSFFG
jgi:hypothetical protein